MAYTKDQRIQLDTAVIYFPERIISTYKTQEYLQCMYSEKGGGGMFVNRSDF
jgi:hypothetical protein